MPTHQVRVSFLHHVWKNSKTTQATHREILVDFDILLGRFKEWMCQWLVTFCCLVPPIIYPSISTLNFCICWSVIPESSRMCLYVSLTKDPKERRDCNRWPIHLCYLKKSEEHFELKKQDLKNCDPNPKDVRYFIVQENRSIFLKSDHCV